MKTTAKISGMDVFASFLFGCISFKIGSIRTFQWAVVRGMSFLLGRCMREPRCLLRPLSKWIQRPESKRWGGGGRGGWNGMEGGKK